MNTAPIYQHIARSLRALRTCEQRIADPSRDCNENDSHWATRQKQAIERIVRNDAPSGSGIDCGTAFDFDASKPERLVFSFEFHHMNDVGMYNGWTEHRAIVKPSLANGIDLRLTGHNRNDVLDYLHECFDCFLMQRMTDDEYYNMKKG